MFYNYFKLAIRNLWRHKAMAGINIAGLATGIACCLLIALYVLHETSYDQFNAKADRVARVTMEFSADGVPVNVSVTGNKVLPAFKRVFPEVENGVRIYPASEVVKYNNQLADEKNFIYADSAFFDVFSFKLLRGDAHTVLSKAGQVVLTASTAQRYFGQQDPVGKRLHINNEVDYVVTGVVEDCPPNSQIKFDFLGSFYSLDEDIYKDERWWDASYYTYLLLKSPGAIKTLQAKIPGYMKTQNKENGISNNDYMTFHLQPLKDVHLYSRTEGGLQPGGDYHYVYIFSAIALLILAIACANYINLTTARATERAREVGVRKVMGALRQQLFRQFMGESLVTVFIALLISLLLIRLLLPVFNTIADTQLYFTDLLQPAMLFASISALLVISLLGGSYPALVLSGFNPIKVLKGDFKTGSSGVWLRKSLIVVQFFISVALIVSTIIIYSQLTFIQQKKIGYNRNHIVVLPEDMLVRQKSTAFKSAFLSNKNILDVTSCGQLPTFVPGKYGLGVQNRNLFVTAVRADKDFIKTLELKIAAGSDFTETEQLFADSPVLQRPLIINETLANMLGWTPAKAVGQFINFQGRKGIVKGVVSDFHFTSMHETIGPFVIFLSNSTRYLLVKISGEQLPATLQFMKQQWSALAPQRPFEYTFLDEEFNKLYKTETKTGRLFYMFAMLAIGLACLGLMGLATFTAQQRTKEIGIRKVLGASVTGIIALLSKDFLKLVILASLIAFPVTGWAISKWLQNFAYRVSIGWWVFALAGTAAIIIALITISFQAIKAALANPVRSLRNE